MKKILFSLLLPVACCLFFTSSAQGNLQFNQVIHFDIAISGTQAIIVPAGKVWKIESASMGSTGTAPSILLRNAAAVNIAHFSSPTSATSAAYPHWLPSGFTGSFLNVSPSFRCSISIIEFNVVP